MTSDAWDPVQYERFRAQRLAPFDDLVALVRPASDLRVVDLGCGTGELTAKLAARLERSTVLGLDSSEAMLARTAEFASARVRFEHGDLADPRHVRDQDVVFSHAAMQWVGDHERFFPALLAAMKPGAQLLVQMPRNFDQPSHTAAADVAREPRFRDALAGVFTPGTLAMERYAQLLFDAGFVEQVTFEKIYPHVLPTTRDVVEWTRGTLLTAYLPRLSPPDREAFLARYAECLLARMGDHSPCFFPFRRLLVWARKG